MPKPKTANKWPFKPYRSYNKNWIPKPIQPYIFPWDFNKTFPLPARQRHAYFVGASGSGKSELMKLAIVNDVHHGAGVLLIDPHGELTEDVLSLKHFEKKYRDRVVFLSPEFAKHGQFFTYNLLQHNYWKLSDLERRAAISTRAKHLVGAFETILKCEISINMELMITSCLRLLMEHKDTTLDDMLNLLSLNRFEDYQEMINNHWDERLKIYFNGDFQDSKSTRKAVAARLENALSNVYLRHILCAKESSFKLTSLLDQGKVVLLSANKGVLEEDGASILGAFMIAEVAAHAFKRGLIKEEFERSIFLYIDECHNFISSKIDIILSETRKYNVHIALANQFVGQIEDSRIRKSVMANTNLKVCGSASATDKEAIGKEIDFDIKAVDKLNEGRFVVGQKNGYLKPVVIKAWSYLVFDRKKLKKVKDRGKLNRNYMRAPALEKLKEQQRQQYYINVLETPRKPSRQEVDVQDIKPTFPAFAL